MARDLYQEITSRIIADMESGVLPWQKPWKAGQAGGLGMPMNATTGKAYRGINILLLWAAAARLGQSSCSFLTFKQALDAGGHVRKGETGSKIYFYKSLEVTRPGEAGGEDETKRIPMLKEFTVFHVSQVEGCCDLKGAAVIDGGALPADTEEFTQALGAHLVHGGDRACYYPVQDRLQMPWARDFRSDNDYRATLYHELTHWTGHKSRNDRPIGNFFGTADYAREELVAEMGGAFLCAEFGLEYQTQHASYLDNWLKVLKEDKRAILKAASQAQKAIDFMRAKVLAAGELAETVAA